MNSRQGRYNIYMDDLSRYCEKAKNKVISSHYTLRCGEMLQLPIEELTLFVYDGRTRCKEFFTNAIFVVRNLRLCDKKGPKSSNKHGRYNKMNSWFIKLLSQQLLLIVIACLNLFFYFGSN